MTPVWVAIIGAIVSIVGAIWPIIKYYDKKRERNLDARLENLGNKIMEPLGGIENRLSSVEGRLDSVEGILKEQKDINTKQDDKFDEIESQLFEMSDNMDKNEKDRLKTEIIDFATKLRNNQQVSMEDFQHIHYVYDKYHSLHGNTYCDSLYSFIANCEKEYLAVARMNERKEG